MAAWYDHKKKVCDTDVVTYVMTSRHDYVRNVLWINKYEHAFKIAW